MDGKTLKYLAAVCELARLDVQAAAITLSSDAGRLQASYAGIYANGSRTVEGQDEGDWELSVSASQFKALAAMYDDDDSIRAVITGDALRLSSRTMTTTLRRWGERNDPVEIDAEDVRIAARISAPVLLSELDAAMGFVSDSNYMPALTGIRLDFGKRLRILAFDGVQALFQSTLRARITGKGSLIVPTQDFILGARLVNEDDAVIAQPNDTDHIALFNSGSLFRSSLMAGLWPDVSRVIAKRDYPSTFNVEAATIRNLVAGAKALDSGPDIYVRPTRGHVIFGLEGESGKFAVAVPGSVAQPLRYDVDTLGRVVKLGSVLTFHVPKAPDEPTLIESEHRRCWVVTRV